MPVGGWEHTFNYSLWHQDNVKPKDVKIPDISVKPIDINIFAADLDDPNQGSFIVFSGLNQSYFNITDYDNTHNLYRYFTADYSCYEIIDTLSATTDPSVKLKMMG